MLLIVTNAPPRRPTLSSLSPTCLRLLSLLETDVSALRLFGIFEGAQAVAGVIVGGHGGCNLNPGTSTSGGRGVADLEVPGHPPINQISIKRFTS